MICNQTQGDVEEVVSEANPLGLLGFEIDFNFTVGIHDMNVSWEMVAKVNRDSEAIFSKDGGHSLSEMRVSRHYVSKGRTLIGLDNFACYDRGRR